MKKLKQLYRLYKFLTAPGTEAAISETLRDYSVNSQLCQNYPGLDIHKDVTVQGYGANRLQIEGKVKIERGTFLAFGSDFNGYGRLSIGGETWIGEYNNFRLGADCQISIGQRCLISQFCSVIGVNHDISGRASVNSLPPDTNKKNIIIGDDVWIGAGSVLLPGIEIGTGAVIGANSTVCHSIPPYEVWGGNPAKKIRTR